MRSVQFAKSRFWTVSATGEPSVSPPRTPPVISTADPARDLDPVLLDLHPAAAAVAFLAARQVQVDFLGQERQSGGDALDDGGEARAMGLARREPAQGRHGGRLTEDVARGMKLSVKGEAIRFEVFAKPRAQRSKILGWRDGRLDVSLAAPPVEGAANAELVATLAKALGVAKAQVQLVRGETGRTKLVEVRGLAEDELRARLGQFRE
jgi:uncharacterized protein (TIGR00251 family)